MLSGVQQGGRMEGVREGDWEGLAEIVTCNKDLYQLKESNM